MTSTTRAVERAIAGGLNIEMPTFLSEDSAVTRATLCRIFLDREFWKCLGKAERWGSFYDKQGKPRAHDFRDWHPDTSDTKSSGSDNKMWQARWHQFIDTLTQGTTAEDFFTSLLKK